VVDALKSFNHKGHEGTQRNTAADHRKTVP
jgi:hypothetical protein